MTIGFENIFSKWYADKMSIKTFRKIISLDPTSIVKKDHVKMGKYSKWLLKQYLAKEFQYIDSTYQHETKCFNWWTADFKISKECRNKIFNNLHIFHFWYKKNKNINRKKVDIFKYRNLIELLQEIKFFEKEYIADLRSKEHKIEIFKIYEDENILILEPLDFAACYKYSKDTEWCSKSESGYNSWRKENLMLRFICKRNKKIYRLTWSYDEFSTFSWATPIYPEYTLSSFTTTVKCDPFEFTAFNAELRAELPLSIWQDCDEAAYEKYLQDHDKRYSERNSRYVELINLFKLINSTAVLEIKKRYSVRKEEYQNKTILAEIQREQENANRASAYVDMYAMDTSLF